MSSENKNSSEEIVIYRRYIKVNGEKIYPKKAKVFKIVLRPKSL